MRARRKLPSQKEGHLHQRPRAPLPRKVAKPSSKPIETQKEKKVRESPKGKKTESPRLVLKPKAKPERRRSLLIIQPLFLVDQAVANCGLDLSGLSRISLRPRRRRRTKG